jgi:hypothetical protein
MSYHSNMKISVIFPDRVDESKGGFLSHVDDTAELNDLSEFAETGTILHIAPGIFKDNIKRQDHLEQIEFICFDFDDGKISSEEIHKQLIYNINHVILASKNWNIDKKDGKGPIERFHLFIPTDIPIISVDLYKYICKKVAQLYLWQADKNCMEPSRYFYKHSGILFVHDKSKPLEVERFKKLQELEKKPESIFLTYDNDNTSSLDKFRNTRIYKSLINGSLKSDGERYNTSNKIIGTMIKCGCTEQEIMGIIDEHSVYGKSFTRQSIVRRIQDWK